jgi:hypothetical protein
MSSTKLCNKCFRPKHEKADLGLDRDVTLCVAMPEDRIIFTDQYQCGCCKCSPEIATLLKGQRYSACKHFPFMQEDFDCPMCSAEAEVAKTSTVCVGVDIETGAITFDTVNKY